MKSKIDPSIYYNLEANIQKKSTSFFLGYQTKFWKILDNGTKIAYRNPLDTQFSEQKTFNLTDVKTQQLQSMDEFELHTPDRIYELKAQSDEQCKLWMRAITMLKKDIRRKNRKKSPDRNKHTSRAILNDQIVRETQQNREFTKLQKRRQTRSNSIWRKTNQILESTAIQVQQKPNLRETYQNKKGLNDETLPSVGQVFSFQKYPKGVRDSISILNQTGSFIANNNISRTSISFSPFTTLDQQVKQHYKQFWKKLGPNYINFHVFITKLKTKSKQLLMTSTNSFYYIFFSSKSLYPEQHINQDNLTYDLLPYWADLNCFYRLNSDKSSQKMFDFLKILNIQETEESCAVKVKTEQQTYEFFVQTLEEQKGLTRILSMGKDNALQTCRDDRCKKKNYDLLVLLHTTNLIQFKENILQTMKKMMPEGHQYELNIFTKFVNVLNPHILEITTILQFKVNKQNVQSTLIDFVKVIHDQIKILLKLVWDTSYYTAKGVDISSILRAISTYHNLVNKYVVKDKEIYEAQKQLSKIYMRSCYKNFQKIIINIVQKQKKAKYYQAQNEGDEPFTQTHAVTDIFKFIYDVFGLAFPCWNDKLHLHNIHKLTYKALSVFITELKSMVDQQQLSTPLLIAISNNYITFCDQVDEFYQNKFTELKQRTKQCYDELRNQFRQMSMVIIDKLVLPIKIQLKIFFDKQKFYTASMQEAYRLILKSELYQNFNNVHFVLKKRYYQRIFSTIRQQICKMLQREVQNFKKKKELAKVLERLNNYKVDCLQLAQLLCKSKLKIEREYGQLHLLLTTQKKQEIAFIMTQANQFYKRVYKKSLILREDYNSMVQNYLKVIEIDSPLKRPPKQHKQVDMLQARKSFSKEYMIQYDRSSIEYSSTQKVTQPANYQQKIKFISQGFVYRGKIGTVNYDRIYLKLKKSVLYIYENEKMERCQNTVQIEDIQDIKVPNPEKPYFTIYFLTLNRSKELKIKCQTTQQCRRWVYSIELDLRRVKNDKKMKVIKQKQLTCNIIIDYDELTNGKDYFSYSKQ